MSKIRMGIIGCGSMNTNHERGLLDLADDVQVTCTCDIDRERAQRSAEHVHAEHVFTDYKDMVDYVDAVLIVLPHHLHYEAGMFFIENGKHVLMEKPMCNTEEECLRMVKAAEEKHVKLMVAYPVPYWPEIIKLKELVDDGIIGDVFNMSIWTEQSTGAAFSEKTWLHSAEKLGGGQLFSHGCHYIDILLRFLGEPVSGAHVGTNYGTPWMEKEGTSHVTIKFANGALGYHMGTWGARGTQLGRSFHIHGTKGMLAYTTAAISENGGKILLYRNLNKNVMLDEDPNAKDIEVLWSTEDYVLKKTAEEIYHFIKCIKEDLSPLTDGYDSIQSLRVIWRLYEAEEKGIVADLRGLGLKQKYPM